MANYSLESLTAPEENSDVSLMSSIGAGIVTGLIKIPEGAASLYANIYDLTNDSDTALDVEKYNNTLFAWQQKNETMTGHDHKNLIAGNDPEFAADTIVMEEVTTGVGDKKETKFSEYDLQQFNEADEGQVIIIGGKMFVKDSSIAGGPNNPPKMKQVDYTQLKIKSPPKKKK